MNESIQLLTIFQLISEIEVAINDHCLHLRLFSDGSGGLYQQSRTTWTNYVELVEWFNLSDAVFKLTSYLGEITHDTNH